MSSKFPAPVTAYPNRVSLVTRSMQERDTMKGQNNKIASQKDRQWAGKMAEAVLSAMIFANLRDNLGRPVTLKDTEEFARGHTFLPDKLFTLKEQAGSEE